MKSEEQTYITVTISEPRRNVHMYVSLNWSIYENSILPSLNENMEQNKRGKSIQNKLSQAYVNL